MVAASTETPETGAPRYREVPIPPGPDPIVNAPLTPLGPDADGVARYWISTVNPVAGATGICVRADGRARTYRFGAPHSCVYGVALEDPDTLWLCGDLSRMLRLSLSTGEVRCFPTGAPQCLVFQGMALDPATGLLLAIGYDGTATTAVTFDIHRHRTRRVHVDVCRQMYMRASRAEPDGTVTIAVEIPDVTYLTWDPPADTLTDRRTPHGFWLPWMEPGVVPGPNVLDSRDGLTWTVPDRESGIVLRSVDGGSTATAVCEVPDATFWNLALTDDRKVLAVNVFGEFFRFDADTGALELTRRLPTAAVGYVDCVIGLDDDRVLGSSFINQRFWTADLAAGTGSDCGRAGPGFGEVLQVAAVGKLIYLATYMSGELNEYDPRSPARFPENPRVVARPPGGMRPAAISAAGPLLYYSCNRSNGVHGCVLTCYDTETGRARYAVDPVADQSIRSLHWHAPAELLVAGTSIHADCRSAPPTRAAAAIVLFEAHILNPTVIDMPAGTESVAVHGELADSTLLCSLILATGEDPAERWFRFDPHRPSTPSPADLWAIDGISYDDATYARPDLEVGPARIHPTRRPGIYVVETRGEVAVWSMDRPAKIATLHASDSCYRVAVHGASVLVVEPDRILRLDEVLLPYL